MVIRLDIPVRVVSEANQREFWTSRMRRKRAQQGVVMLFAKDIARRLGESQIKKIVLTRIVDSRGKKMDLDNLAGAFKHVQDEIARIVGIDDGKIRWEYAQGRSRENGVRVEIHLS